MDPNFNNFNISNDEIDLRDLFSGILRKKKFLFLTAGLIFSGSIVFTSYMRIFKPVYSGSFTLLITDPINQSQTNGAKRGFDQSFLFEDVAINTNTYEEDTLIELLKSQLFLNKVEKDLNLPKNFLVSRISITKPKNKTRRGFADGILNIKLLIENRDKGKLILDKLSEFYLEASYSRRQQKLNDGLEFLDKQAPKIQNKTEKLQSKLVEFREKYKLIEPSAEGVVLKNQQQLIEQNIINLKSERNRLLNVRKKYQMAP